MTTIEEVFDLIDSASQSEDAGDYTLSVIEMAYQVPLLRAQLAGLRAKANLWDEVSALIVKRTGAT